MLKLSPCRRCLAVLLVLAGLLAPGCGPASSTNPDSRGTAPTSKPGKDTRQNPAPKEDRG